MKRLLLLPCTLLFACAMQKSAVQKSAAPPSRSVQEEPAPAASVPVPTEPAGANADKAPSSAPPPASAKKPAAAAGGGAGGAGGAGMVVLPSQIAAAQTEFDDASKAFTASGGDCPSLCKSLGSMSNATEHLCGLVEGTSDGQRCLDARARLAAAQAKVKSTCGATCG